VNRAPPHRSGSVPLVLFGIPFHNLTFASALDWIDELVAAGKPSLVATANLDFLRVAAEDPEMQRILFDADIVMADGHPIVALSSLFGPALRERVTGSDLTPMLAEHAAEKGHRLFFLGGAPGGADKAARLLVERHPGLVVAGCYSPAKADVIEMDDEDILARLERARPDILLVALGAPKQEKWIHMQLPRWSVPVAIGVGGSLDFIAGAQRRAPRWLQRLGLEWLGRLAAAPRRLAGRYARDALFLARAMIRLARVRLARRRPLPIPLADRPESAMLPALNASFAFMEPVRSLADAEDEARRLLEAAGGGNLAATPRREGWLNSAELGVLVRTARALRETRRLLVVLPASRRVADQLRALGLDRCFAVETDAQALIERLRTHRRESSTGGVDRDEAHRLRIELPAELTASNKDALLNRLRAAWGEPGERPPAEISVDALSMRFIDSAGLALLVGLRKRARAENIPLAFTGFQETVLQIFRTARLESLFGAEERVPTT
jgi:N-acetylglucosaminyldiphosphoundecaprenol N-acetyl-beta-D-mannosaminyltransferase